jgi:antitoxin ChpS
MHTTSLRKVGGSIMLAVPPAILDLLHLHPGATVGLAVDHGRLVVEPTLRPHYSPHFALREGIFCEFFSRFKLFN